MYESLILFVQKLADSQVPLEQHAESIQSKLVLHDSPREYVTETKERMKEKLERNNLFFI